MDESLNVKSHAQANINDPLKDMLIEASTEEPVLSFEQCEPEELEVQKWWSKNRTIAEEIKFLTGQPPKIDPKTSLRTDIYQDTYTFMPMSKAQQKAIIEKEFKDAKATPHILKQDKMIDMGCPALKDLDLDHFCKLIEESFSDTCFEAEKETTKEIMNTVSSEAICKLIQNKCHGIKISWLDDKLAINGTATKITAEEILLLGVNKIVNRIKRLF